MATPGKPGLQILIVDDEPTVCRSIKMLLEHEGPHRPDGRERRNRVGACLSAAASISVITDFFMAGMDGDQLAARIKQRRPGQPVIMATASIYGRNTADHPSACVDYLLNKPFTLQELRDAIAWVMH